MAWPHPTLASSWRASTSWRLKSAAFMRRGAGATSRMKTGRPLPRTVTAERPWTASSGDESGFSTASCWPRSPSTASPTRPASPPSATTTARSSRPCSGSNPRRRPRSRTGTSSPPQVKTGSPRVRSRRESSTCTAPCTFAIGRPTISSPTRTSRTGCTATVSGSRKVKRHPAPGRLSISSVPPSDSTVALHHVEPDARARTRRSRPPRSRGPAGRRAAAPRDRRGPRPAPRRGRRAPPRPAGASAAPSRARRRRSPG